MNPNVPGELPFVELGVVIGLGLIYTALAGHLLLRTTAHCRDRILVLAMLIGVPALYVLAMRHGNDWKDIRDAIRTYSTKIDEAAVGLHKPLSAADFQRIKAAIIPQPVELHFRSGGPPVYLRMAHGTYPFVGVDFGEGAHAEFAPLTMAVIYAD